MAWLSRDGAAYLGVGQSSVCVECDEPTHLSEDHTQHGPHCSQAPNTVAVPPQAPRRTTDPNLYVMTDRGFERAIVVERRREQARKGR